MELILSPKHAVQLKQSFDRYILQFFYSTRFAQKGIINQQV